MRKEHILMTLTDININNCPVGFDLVTGGLLTNNVQVRASLICYVLT
jgi:hypothetical protein